MATPQNTGAQSPALTPKLPISNTAVTAEPLTDYATPVALDFNDAAWRAFRYRSTHGNELVLELVEGAEALCPLPAPQSHRHSIRLRMGDPIHPDDMVLALHRDVVSLLFWRGQDYEDLHGRHVPAAEVTWVLGYALGCCHSSATCSTRAF